MVNPTTSLTVFDFYCDGFEDLPAKMEQQVGYKVLPKHVWSINFQVSGDKMLHVTLTILYWKG